MNSKREQDDINNLSCVTTTIITLTLQKAREFGLEMINIMGIQIQYGGVTDDC